MLLKTFWGFIGSMLYAEEARKKTAAARELGSYSLDYRIEGLLADIDDDIRIACGRGQDQIIIQAEFFPGVKKGDDTVYVRKRLENILREYGYKVEIQRNILTGKRDMYIC